MFKELIKDYADTIKESVSQSAMILKELDELQKRRDDAYDAIQELHAALPQIKEDYYKLLRVYGIRANDITKEDVEKAKALHGETVRTIRELTIQLKELERSIEVLQDEAAYAAEAEEAGI